MSHASTFSHRHDAQGAEAVASLASASTESGEIPNTSVGLGHGRTESGEGREGAESRPLGSYTAHEDSTRRGGSLNVDTEAEGRLSVSDTARGESDTETMGRSSTSNSVHGESDTDTMGRPSAARSVCGVSGTGAHGVEPETATDEDTQLDDRTGYAHGVSGSGDGQDFVIVNFYHLTDVASPRQVESPLNTFSNTSI